MEMYGVPTNLRTAISNRQEQNSQAKLRGDTPSSTPKGTSAPKGTTTVTQGTTSPKGTGTQTQASQKPKSVQGIKPNATYDSNGSTSVALSGAPTVKPDSNRPSPTTTGSSAPGSAGAQIALGKKNAEELAKLAKDRESKSGDETPETPEDSGGSGGGGYGGGGSGKKSGGKSGGKGSVLKLDEDGIRQIIETLKQASTELTSNWEYIKTNCVSKINNSWGAADAEEYINKLLAEETSITKVNNAITLLMQTYQKTLDTQSKVQEENMGYINSAL